jgi:hypothetical protein
MCWVIVVLGVRGVKPTGEGVLGTLAGGELETTDLGSGYGCTPQCIPTVMVFGA